MYWPTLGERETRGRHVIHACRHLSPSSDRREGGVERVKDALGITGIVGAGPIVAAAAELMRNSPRRLTCGVCVTYVSESHSV